MNAGIKAFKNFYALWSKKFYIKVCKILKKV